MTLNERIRVAAGWAIKPPAAYDPASWAAARRELGTAESAKPGRWDNATTPYAVEPMVMMSPDHPCPRVVLMFASQLVKSEICNNVIGYYIDWQPRPIMMLLPTIEMAEIYSKNRIAPMLAGPAFVGKISEPRARGGGNTLLLKEFPGGMFLMAGANAPGKLASWPMGVLIADEIGRFPDSAKAEGSPLHLARVRLSSYGESRAKELDTSSPGIKGRCAIEREYSSSSQAQYFVPCPHCGAHQVLSWSGLHWEGDISQATASRAWYECEACHAEIDEHHKTAMFSQGAWRHTHPFRDVKGYQINALYAPVGRVGWRLLAAEFVEATARAKLSDTSLLQVFVNTRLGETWEDRGETVDTAALSTRPRFDAGAVPAGVRCITLGVDTQDDRLEVEAVGWGFGHESWSLGYYVIPTDPLDTATWSALDDLVLRTWVTADGRTLKPAASCVDSGGHRVQSVYEYAGKRTRWRVFAVKGLYGSGPIWDKTIRRGGKNKNLGRFHVVGVDTAKDAVAAYLRVDAPGPGYCHFPADRDQGYFDQLTSEKRMKKKDYRGRERWGWHKTNAGSRNEALDCRVYALAALHSLIVSGMKLDPPRSTLLEATPPATPAPPLITDSLPKPPPPRQAKPRPPAPASGWLTGGSRPRGGGYF